MSEDQKVHIKSEIKQDKFSIMGIPTLWIGVLAFVVIALWAFGSVSANEVLNESTGGNSLSLNPELSVARRSVEVAASSRESDYLARNPELKSARMFAGNASSGQTHNMVANPELNVARRYDETAKEVQDKLSVGVANPELSAANRFAEISAAGLEEPNLYLNPELKVVASQTVIMNGDYDSGFLANNPEISTHRRFVEGIDR